MGEEENKELSKYADWKAPTSEEEESREPTAFGRSLDVFSQANIDAIKEKQLGGTEADVAADKKDLDFAVERLKQMVDLVNRHEVGYHREEVSALVSRLSSIIERTLAGEDIPLAEIRNLQKDIVSREVKLKSAMPRPENRQKKVA